MPRKSSFYVVKDVKPKPNAPIEALASFHDIPRHTQLDQWALEHLARKKANAGDWCVRLSVTTLISLLVAIKEGKT